VLYQQVPSSNPPRHGVLFYVNGFIENVIHKCGKASPGFPHEVFLRINIYNQSKGLP
jgi:hypothetical protein